MTPGARRRRLDLPRLPRAAGPVAHRQGAARRHPRRARARPARLRPRPAPHGRRQPVRRWRRHGDEARAVGRGARRRRRARGRRGEAGPCRTSSCPARVGCPSRRPWPARWRRSRGWRSPAGATRASTSACTSTPRSRMPVTVVSLGDYVLNGGEVAVLAMVEAVGRLLPGVVGNAESLVEESHEDGLLEYPVYTRPASWDDAGTVREVPAVLLSGDHGAIAALAAPAAPRAHRRPSPRPAAGVGHDRGAGRPRRAGGRARRRRRAARAPAGLLGAGGARGPGPLGRAAAGRGARRRGARPGGVDDVCRARARPPAARRDGWSPRCGRDGIRTTPRAGRWAGSWWRRTSRGAGSGASCWRSPSRSRRPTSRRFALTTGVLEEGNQRF